MNSIKQRLVFARGHKCEFCGRTEAALLVKYGRLCCIFCDELLGVSEGMRKPHEIREYVARMTSYVDQVARDRQYSAL